MAKSVELPLLGQLGRLPAYQDLLESLGQPALSAERVGLGLPRAARLALLAALHLDLQVPLVLLTNRADRALGLFDELNFWLPDAKIRYFPEPNPGFYEKLPWSESTRRERLQVFAELAQHLMPGAQKPEQPPIIVAPVRAVMSRTIPRRDFLKQTMRLELNQKRDLTETVRQWVGLGYQPSSIVVQPGQFSRRGGILDIWSPAHELPLRLEFFGDELDTLRYFNPATQRSEATQKEALVFPSSEALPAFAEKAGLDLDTLSELEIPQLYSYPASLMDYLPENSLVLLDGQEFIQAAVDDIERDAAERAEEMRRQRELAEDSPVPYLTWSEIEDSFARRKVLELGYTNAGEGSALAAAFDPGPRFAGRLKEFQQHLQYLEREGQAWHIVSRQAARLRQLWSETHPSYTEADLNARFIEGSLSSGWITRQPEGKLHNLLSDSEIFGWSRPQPRRRPFISSESPEAVYGDLNPGDWVVHVDHGIGQFVGLLKPTLDGVQREYLTIQYKDNDQLYVPIHQADRISRYIGTDGSTPSPNRLGSAEWGLTKHRVRHAVIEVAEDLLELYAKRKAASGYSFSPDSDWQKELEASFPYIETPDQLLALEQVKSDMESERPMDRLLCGDVGFGKTEVALRAAFKAVSDGKQVAILVPTTVLAQQHFDTFSQRLSVFPVTVEMLSRFRSNKEQNEIIKKLAAGKIDILIGTHRLISQDVQFSDLGLVIIDEEQRFGVAHKEHLKKLRAEVDVLTLTATPIPRTLYMALTGVRDISTINSPPEERLPVITHIGPYDTKLVREAIIRELDRGGQVFFVHNRVQSIPAVYNHLSKLVPEARIGIGHGQINENQLAEVMHAFNSNQIDVLLCTSIIESGLDIPNANTLIIDRADTFGLAQLYQLRGRVGRGAQRAFAYLFNDRRFNPTPEGQERLEVLADNSQLGAGYAIAMRDLEMRGAGDLLGSRQSGYIQAVGFQLYTRLLAQAVKEQRVAAGLPAEEPGQQLNWGEGPALQINVDLPLASEIPATYIPDQELRLTLYRRIAALRSEEEIAQTEIEFSDRFGPLPTGVADLFYQMQLKLLGEEAGVDSIGMVNGQVVLNWPPLPKGVKERPLPELDPIARVGRNGYWIRLEMQEPEWKGQLLGLLRKLNTVLDKKTYG